MNNNIVPIATIVAIIISETMLIIGFYNDYKSDEESDNVTINQDN